MEGDVFNDGTWNKNGLSEENLKEFVDCMDWTAVTIGKKSGHAYFKSIPYCLKASELVPLKGAKGIWLRETADPEALAEPAG